MPSVDDGFYLQIGGLRQWVAVRGARNDNPVLLILPGAGVGLARVAPYFLPWQADFTLAFWDQPGSGATAASNPPLTSLTYDRLAQDGLAVCDALWRRYGGRPVGLLSTSGGSVVGLKMAKTHPGLVGCHIGVGQVVNRARQERLSYEMVLQRARAAGDAQAVANLEAIGPPPYADVQGDVVKSVYANAPTPQEARELAELQATGDPPPGAKYVPFGVKAAEPQATAFAAYQMLRKELAAFDARDLGMQYDVPMVFLQGAEDAHTVTSEVEDFAGQIMAPKVLFETIPGAGHLAFFLRQPILARLQDHVRPLLQPGDS